MVVFCWILLTSSPCVLHRQVVTSLKPLLSSASPTAPARLVVRFGTGFTDGYLGSIASQQLVLRMTASILTSETTKFAVILGQQVRAPSW